MYKLGFVILHYMSLEDTVECIDSIQDHMDVKEYSIIVVDNRSPNESGIQLKKLYKDYERVTIILNQVNGGFSKGNNIGISEARRQKCDFIVVLNNDTCMIQNNFAAYIFKEYEYSQFAVLGPQIITADGRNDSNPIGNETSHSVQMWKRGVQIAAKNYVKTLFHIDGVHFFKKSENKNPKPINGSKFRQENVALHGCCWIFSPQYFKKYCGLEELTFMYGEETILALNCEKESLLMVYNPDYKLFHKEAAATNFEKSRWKRKLLYRRRMMKAVWAIYKKLKKEV